MMHNFRLGLLLIFVAVLVIFIQQNLAPVLPLTFLGMKTVAFPLSLWVLLALAAGGLTSWVIVMVLKLHLKLQLSTQPATVGRSVQQTQPRNSKTGRQTAASYEVPDSEPSSATASYGSYSTARSPERQEFEPVGGWQEDGANWVDDDEENWVDEPMDEPMDRPPKSARVEEVSPPKTDYEVPQEPINKYQSGSIYSYSYRSPENTGVGTTESVEDAEYRVIAPPPPDSSSESPSEEYASESPSEEYASEDDSPEPRSDSSKSAAQQGPVPRTEVQQLRSTPTKIQTDNNEDDWSQPSNNNDNDWV